MKLLDIVKTITDPDAPLNKDQKQKFIRAVATFNELGPYIYKDSEKLRQITENLKAIGTLTEKLAFQESDDWFDQNTIKKDMKVLKDAISNFEKTAKEMYSMQQRLESEFEAVGGILSKYFEINED